MKFINRRSFLTTSLFSVSGIMISGSMKNLTNYQSRPFGELKSSEIVVETIYGKVRGYSFNGVNIFRGIPYGGPTEGIGRFLPPTMPKEWRDVKDCTVSGFRCVQFPGSTFTDNLIGTYFAGNRPDRLEIAQQQESENCLNLNVLTKGFAGNRPVMVYVHGGGFFAGSGILTIFGDKHVQEQDVVLVGITHRLSVFGYTYLGGLSEKYALGNPGQLDLIAALKWVRDNISNFGGDPNNVMIFGESGGGAKISTLLAMPAAKGLFHKAAIQSGSFIHKATDIETATQSTKRLMDKLGVTKVEDLIKVPANDLLKADLGAALGASPVVDGHSLLRHPWYPDSPEISADIPLLLGCDKDESSLFVRQNPELFNLDNSSLRTELIKANMSENQVDALLALYKRDHPQDSPSDLYFRISTDRGARFNAAKQAEMQLARGKTNVFMYYFQYNTPIDQGKLRSFHTADLPLIMRLTLFPETERLSRQLSGAWAAFARNSDPSQNGLPWPAYTIEKRATMVFDSTKSEAINDPDRDERIMINKLPSGGFI